MTTAEAPTTVDFRYGGLSSAEREELQLHKLRKLIRFLTEKNTYWRDRFRESGVTADGIKSPSQLVELPWLDKHRYLADMEEKPPYGGLLSQPLDEIESEGAILYHTTGTSGRQGRFINTVAGFRLYGEDVARVVTFAGIEPGQRIMPCFPFSLWALGWGIYHASLMGPYTLVPGGIPIHRELRWELLERYRPDAVILTPSFALHLGKLAGEDGFDLAGLGVRRVLVSGETFAEARRRDIERYWGCAGGVRSFYGLSEGGPMLAGSECEAQDGMHLFEDRAVHLFLEPDKESPQQVAPGELGEYMFTNLDQRILATWFNFRTRDSATYSDEPCSCGRPGRRMWIHDRLDDMRKIRGVNVFASGVEALIREIPTLAEEFQLVVSEDESGRVKLTVRAEAPEGVDPAARSGEADALTEKLHTAFGLRMDVEIVRYAELPRWELKARRWLDLRQAS